MSIKLGNIEDIVMKRVISAGDSVVCVNVEGAQRSKLVVGYVYQVKSVVGKDDADDQVGRINLCGVSDWSFKPERFELLDDSGIVDGSDVFAIGNVPEPLKALNVYRVDKVFNLVHLNGEERKVRLVGFGDKSFNITHFSLTSKHIKFSDHQIHHTAGTTVKKTTVPNSGELTFSKKGPSVVEFVKVEGISEFIVLHQLYYNKDKDMWDSNLMGEELDGQLDWIRGAWHMFKEQYNG